MSDQLLKKCPECSSPLAGNSPIGLCAACLLRAGLADGTDPTAGFEQVDRSIPSQIGPYKLLEQIGEGGFGVVFMAEQLEPVRRRVAIKLVKPGMDSRQIVARFEAERQALAMMNHENIARVLDAGTTENGRPYFVMELVRGIPITQYCDRQKLSPRERLDLMIRVCRAIQHAHQKGIIHRDIKPSNVLVTLYDGRPVPKVIDFGVAKAIQQPLTDKTMFTRFGQVMGTFEYMSPEQAEMSGLDIDTRGDIYSLGVLMYELLTGSTPISRERLKTAAIDEVLRLIRDEEPQRPSLRLDQSGDAKPTISSERGMAPEKLWSLLQGELDWIVMKALEKDRSRRYGTAKDFAADIQRFLDNEPVLAAPPSTIYRIRKFVGKNRMAVGFAVVLASVVLVGLLTSIALYVRSEKLRSIADRSAGQLADESRRLASALREAEDQRLEKSQALEDRETALLERTEALRQSNALRLAAESSLQVPTNPGLALSLAHEALQLEPASGEANSSFINAINRCHEIKTIFFEEQIYDAGFSDDGSLAAVRTENQIEIWDLKKAKQMACIQTRGSLNTSALEFSPDGSQLAVLTSGCSVFTRTDGNRIATTDRVARLFDAGTGKEQFVLRGHEDRVVSVEFNHDGSLLITASWDGSSRIWNTEDGQCLHILDYDENRGSNSNQDLAEILDELAVQSEDSLLSLERATFIPDSNDVHLVPLTGRLKSVFGFYGVSNFEIHEFDPKLEYLESEDEFTGGGGGTTGWSTTSVKPGGQVFSAESGTYSETLDFVPVPERKRPGLEAKIIENEILILENNSRSVEIARLRGHRQQVLKAVIEPSGRYVFSAGQNSLRIWQTGKISFATHLIGHDEFITCVDISDDGQFVATGSADGSVRVWSAADGEPLAMMREDYEFVKKEFRSNLHQNVLSVRFDRSGKNLLTLSSDRAVQEMSEDGKTELKVHPINVVRVWDWHREKLVRGWPRVRRSYLAQAHDYNYESVAFRDDGGSVVAVDSLENGQVKVTKKGRLLSSASINGLMTTTDSEGNRKGPHLGLRSWNIAGNNSDFEIIPDCIGGEAFLSENGRIAVLETAECCQVIDTLAGKLIAKLPRNVFSDDRQPVFSHSDEYVLVFPQMVQPDGFCGQLWDLQHGDKFADLVVPGSILANFDNSREINSAAFDPGGCLVAVALRGGWVLLWNWKSKKLDAFRAHSQKINDVVFDAGGQLLATCSSDRTVRIWKVETLRKYIEFGPHESEVTAVAFSPNDDYVVTVAKQKTARVWPLDPMLPLMKIQSEYPVELPRPLTGHEKEQFGLVSIDELRR